MHAGTDTRHGWPLVRLTTNETSGPWALWGAAGGRRWRVTHGPGGDLPFVVGDPACPPGQVTYSLARATGSPAHLQVQHAIQNTGGTTARVAGGRFSALARVIDTGRAASLQTRVTLQQSRAARDATYSWAASPGPRRGFEFDIPTSQEERLLGALTAPGPVWVALAGPVAGLPQVAPYALDGDAQATGYGYGDEARTRVSVQLRELVDWPDSGVDPLTVGEAQALDPAYNQTLFGVYVQVGAPA